MLNVMGGEIALLYIVKQYPIIILLNIMILFMNFFLLLMGVGIIFVNGFSLKSLYGVLLLFIVIFNVYNLKNVLRNILLTFFRRSYINLYKLFWRIYIIPVIEAEDSLRLLRVINDNNLGNDIIFESTYVMDNIEMIASNLPQFEQLNLRFLVKDKNTLMLLKLLV